MQHPETMQVIYLSAPDAGPVDINASDFDKTKHQAFDPDKPAAPVKTLKRGRKPKNLTETE